MYTLAITFTNGILHEIHGDNTADLENWIILWQRWQLGEDVQPFASMKDHTGSIICVRLQFVVSMSIKPYGA